MPLIFAIGSSLVSATAFGFTTAENYAPSGLVDWQLVAFFIAGGVAGGFAGRLGAEILSSSKQVLSRIFAGLVAAVGAFVVWKTFSA